MSQGSPYPPLDTFKSRELEVLGLIAEGMTNEEIAERLFIEVTTVRWHNRQIYSKLGVHHRTLAVARARELGLLDEETPPSLIRAAVLSKPLTNLPTQTTSFVGREREIARARQLLSGARLVTMTGPGGIGKTRLALEVAAALAEYYADGVWFVPLAAVHDPRHVASAIAAVLQVKETAAETIETSLVKFLSARSLLLVIDNFEHVIPAVSILAKTLAEAANVKMLVTSREILRLYGEQEYPIPPLTTAETQVAYTPQELAEFEAVRLFVERAQAVDPDFCLTDEAAEAIAAICTRVDGLPLAIELAAARVKLFSPQQILTRLESGLGVLGQGPRDAPARQRTLQATIDWSYNLLDEEEKRLFNRLGVFRGGWTLEAMEAICSDGLQVDLLDGLSSLIDKSLIQIDESADEEPRFRMLETVREYAVGHLYSPDADETQERHYNWFLQLAASGETGIVENPQWYKRMHLEEDNLLAALEWCQQAPQRLQSGLRLVNALMHYWSVRGSFREGRQWLTWFLDRTQGNSTPERSFALTAAGEMAFRQGEYEEVVRLCRESLEISEVLSLSEATAYTLRFLASALQKLGSYTEAEAMLERSLALFHDAGNDWGYALSLDSLGELRRLSDRFAEAQALFEQAAALNRKINHQAGVIASLCNLGHVLCRQNNAAAAVGCFRESLDTAGEIGHKIILGLCIAGFGAVAAVKKNPERAVQLLSAASRLFSEMDYVLEPADQAQYEWIESLARSQLTEALYHAAWDRGQRMTLEQTVAYALANSTD